MNGLVLDNDAFEDLSVTIINGIYAIVKNIKLNFLLMMIQYLQKELMQMAVI